MARQADTTGPSAEVIALMDLIIAVKDDKRTWRRVVGKPQYVPQRDEFPTRDESISCLVRAPNPTRSERIIVRRASWESDLLLKDHDARYMTRPVYTSTEGLHMTYVGCGHGITPCPRHAYDNCPEVKR